MWARIGLLTAVVAMAVPATAVAQGADLGYGGVLGDQNLVPPVTEGGGDAGQPSAIAEAPAPAAGVAPDAGVAPAAGGVAPAEEGVSATRPAAGGGALPFTGVDLAAIAAAGLLMILMGAGLRRRGNAAA